MMKQAHSFLGVALALSLSATAAAADVPKLKGKPNLNGIWQAMNSANWWNRNSLPAGTKIVVNAFQARDGALRASARDIVFPDGRKLDLASSYQTGQGKKDEKEGSTKAP